MSERKTEKLTLKDKDGKDINVRIKMPTVDDHHQSQFVAAKVMREALEGGVIVKAKLKDHLKDQGLWDDEMEAKARKMAEDLRELEVQLAKGVNNSGGKLSKADGRALALQIRERRAELDDFFSTTNAYDDITAESLAQNAKFDYLASRSLYNDDTDELFFKSVDDYKNNGNQPWVFAAVFRLSMLLFPSEDSRKKLIENQFLKKYGYVNENLRLVNEAGHLIDDDGRLIDENGNYVQEDGSKCDKFGNVLDDDGNLILTAEYNDPTAEGGDEKPVE